MTICLGKSCSLCLLCVSERLSICVYSFPFYFEVGGGRGSDLIVLVPDHCPSFYLKQTRALYHTSYKQSCKIFNRKRFSSL